MVARSVIGSLDPFQATAPFRAMWAAELWLQIVCSPRQPRSITETLHKVDRGTVLVLISPPHCTYLYYPLEALNQYNSRISKIK